MSKELEALEWLNYYKNKLQNSGQTIRPNGFDIIETALKNYEKLTNKPITLYGRTHGHTQALIDTICKNYKEVKITNLEDKKKLKALVVLKDLFDFDFALRFPTNQPMLRITNKLTNEYWEIPITQKGYDLLKEVML